MNLHAFVSNYHMLFKPSPIDHEIGMLKLLTRGLSSLQTGKIINFAVPFLGKNEVYLEIGTFCGYTLAAACLHNPGSPCIGIDNLSFLGFQVPEDPKLIPQRKVVQERIEYAQKLVNTPNFLFIEDDYKNVKLQDPFKIGVFYIDGYHSKEEVIKNFEWGHDKLADQALIIVDDISISNVGEGVEEWVSKHSPDYYEFFRTNSLGIPNQSKGVDEPLFFNGISILWYLKNAKEEFDKLRATPHIL